MKWINCSFERVNYPAVMSRLSVIVMGVFTFFKLYKWDRIAQSVLIVFMWLTGGISALNLFSNEIMTSLVGIHPLYNHHSNIFSFECSAKYVRQNCCCLICYWFFVISYNWGTTQISGSNDFL